MITRFAVRKVHTVGQSKRSLRQGSTLMNATRHKINAAVGNLNIPSQILLPLRLAVNTSHQSLGRLLIKQLQIILPVNIGTGASNNISQ